MNSSQPAGEQPVHQDGDASQRMSALLSQTLEYYPAHYLASQAVLAEVTHSQCGWRCYGAMETGLTFDGMEVTFDYRYARNKEWRRFLIMVTMSNGELTYRDYREMAPGEHSGILAFEEMPTLAG